MSGDGWNAVSRQTKPPKYERLQLRSEQRPELGVYEGVLYLDKEDPSVGYWMQAGGKVSVTTPTHWRRVQ